MAYLLTHCHKNVSNTWMVVWNPNFYISNLYFIPVLFESVLMNEIQYFFNKHIMFCFFYYIKRLLVAPHTLMKCVTLNALVFQADCQIPITPPALLWANPKMGKQVERGCNWGNHSDETRPPRLCTRTHAMNHEEGYAHRKANVWLAFSWVWSFVFLFVH